MLKGKKHLLRNKDKIQMIKFISSMKTPLVVLERLYVKTEKTSCYKEKAGSVTDVALEYKDNSDPNSRKLRNNKLINIKKIHNKPKIHLNLSNKVLRSKTRATNVKNVANVNKDGKSLTLPIVLLEKLKNNDLKSSSFIKKDILTLEKSRHLDNESMVKLNVIRKSVKFNKKKRNFKIIQNKAKVESILEKEKFSKETEATSEKQVFSEQLIAEVPTKTDEIITEKEIVTESIMKSIKSTESMTKNLKENIQETIKEVLNDEFIENEQVETIKENNIHATEKTDITDEPNIMQTRDKSIDMNTDNITDQSCITNQNISELEDNENNVEDMTVEANVEQDIDIINERAAITESPVIQVETEKNGDSILHVNENSKEKIFNDESNEQSIYFINENTIIMKLPFDIEIEENNDNVLFINRNSKEIINKQNIDLINESTIMTESSVGEIEVQTNTDNKLLANGNSDKTIINSHEQDIDVITQSTIITESLVNEIEIGKDKSNILCTNEDPEEIIIDENFADDQTVNVINDKVINNECTFKEIEILECRDKRTCVNSLIDNSLSNEIGEVIEIPDEDTSKNIHNIQEKSVNTPNPKPVYEETMDDIVLTDEEMILCSSDEIVIEESKDHLVAVNENPERMIGDSSIENVVINNANVKSKSDKGLDICVNLQEAYEQISADIISVSRLFENYEHHEKVDRYLDKVPELLCIAESDSDNDVTLIEEENDDDNDNNDNDNYLNDKDKEVHGKHIDSSLPTTNETNQSSTKQKFGNARLRLIHDELFNNSNNDKIPRMNAKSVPEKNRPKVDFKCWKCQRSFINKKDLKTHSYDCMQNTNLECLLCSFKNRNIYWLVKHLQTSHKTDIHSDKIPLVLRIIIEKAKSLKVSQKKPNEDKAPSKVIGLPDFLMVYCSQCGLNYDTIPESDDAVQDCEDCYKELLFYCHRCSKRFVLSPRIGLHVNGQCQEHLLLQRPDCVIAGEDPAHTADLTQRHYSENDLIEPSTCCSCLRKFPGRIACLRHEKHCGKEANLACKFCPYKTKHRSSIKMHMQQHIVNNEVAVRNTEKDSIEIVDVAIKDMVVTYCPKCKKLSKYESVVTSCTKCKTALVFRCNKCQIAKLLYSQLRVHIMRKHRQKVHACPRCKKKFSYFPDLEAHKSNCSLKPFIQCPECPFAVRCKRRMNNHQRRTHPTGAEVLYPCPKCNKIFAARDNLVTHLRKFCGVEPGLFCAHCTFKTRSRYSLTRHIQNIHGELFGTIFQFLCESCGKMYTNVYSYETHTERCQRSRKKK